MSQPHSRPDHEPAPGTPRWVKVFGIIALVVVLVFVILQLTGVAGDHGPGRHSAPGGVIPTSGATALSLRQP